MPPEHDNPPPGFAPCTRPAPHDGPCAHPPAITVPDTAMLVDEGIELHTWPPERRGGQHTNFYSFGVLAIHTATGIACVATEQRSQLGNRKAPVDRLRLLVSANAALRNLARTMESKA